LVTQSEFINTTTIVAFAGPIKSGKCLGIDTPILMYTGEIKPVQDIVVGDLLMGPDSQPRTVISLARGREEMFKVIPVKGDPFVCNRSHILSLKTKHLTIKTKREGKKRIILEKSNGDIKNLSVEEFLSSSKQKKKYKLGSWKPNDPVVFKSNDSVLGIDPYFLGIWLGDGSSANPSITNVDPEIISYTYKYAQSLGLIIKYHKKKSLFSSKAMTYRITSGLKGGRHDRNRLFTYFREYNLIGNKHIPFEYKVADVDTRLKLFAGLIDSDGHKSKETSYEISQKNKVLAEDITFLARSLGFAAYIKEVRKSCMYKGERKWDTYYRISIFGKGLNKIPVLLERKKSLIDNNHDNTVLKTSLESLGEGDYYGFEISGPDRLFLLGDFTVTHNTQSSDFIVEQFKGFKKLSFATPLKDLYCKENNLDRSILNDVFLKEDHRKGMQEFSEKYLARDKYHFYKLLMQEVSSGDSIVIDDLRYFENEFIPLKELGANIIRISSTLENRMARGHVPDPERSNHKSETDLISLTDDWFADTITNDGTLEDLHDQVFVVGLSLGLTLK
jgi:phosphomevalonate kinase